MEKVRSAEFGVRSGGSACALSNIFSLIERLDQAILDVIDNPHTILTKLPVSERYYDKRSNTLLQSVSRIS